MPEHLLDLTPANGLRIKGRSRQPISAEVVRELGPADLALLDVQRNSKPLRLLRLRDSHHRLAQVLACGATPGEAGAQTGYSQSRISILLGDKSFQDLVEVYRRDARELRAEFADMATANMIRGERIIEDALEAVADSSEPPSLSELRPILDIVSDRADRFGYPKKTTTLNVNLDFAGKLESARRRAGLVDVTPSEGRSPAQAKVALTSPATGEAVSIAKGLARPLAPNAGSGSPGGSNPEPAEAAE